MASKRGPSLDSEIDSLFQLPLTEFTAARNALAARLKKEGRADDAETVKALAKPSAPAWAVNRLFGENRKTFDQLIAVAERIRKAQTGQSKNADVGALLAEKKRITADLMDRASKLLGDAGHAASPDAMRRISATLESLAVWGNTDDGPRAGRLTADLDPPGFDALAAFMGGKKINAANVLSFRPRAKAPVEDPAVAKARAREAIKDAEKMLRDAQRAAEKALSAQEKADARVAAVEKQKEEIEARYAEARDEARAASGEAKRAAQAVADAERALAKARE